MGVNMWKYEWWCRRRGKRKRERRREGQGKKKNLKGWDGVFSVGSGFGKWLWECEKMCAKRAKTIP